MLSLTPRTCLFSSLEWVEGKSFLWDASVKGPAITHLAQVPSGFWLILLGLISFAETQRARVGWVEPENVPVDQPGLLREEYYPGGKLQLRSRSCFVSLVCRLLKISTSLSIIV